MAFKHGVYTQEKETSISTPVTTQSGIPFVVGRAPVHTVDGKVNTPVLCNTYAEAMEALGYSDDWKKYELCEMIYSHFQLFGMGPVIFVNVLDPSIHKTNVAPADIAVVDKQAILPLEALITGLKVNSPAEAVEMAIPFVNRIGYIPVAAIKTATMAVYTDSGKETACQADTDYTIGEDADGLITITAAEGGVLETASSCYITAGRIDTVTYVAEVDYTVFYDKQKLKVEVLSDGSIPPGIDALSITYTAVNPDAVTRADVIGGYDTRTKTYSGLEVIDQCYPKYRKLPDLIVCPGWSTNSGVAAAMAAKAANINGLFTAKALIDADCTEIRHYTDVTAWKTKNNLNSKYQVVFWPMAKLDDKIFHLSVQAAGRMAATDNDNGGCPSESPSNKLLQCDGIVLADGTEVNLDLVQANYLNEVAVNTVLNFINGFVLWGNFTACYPGNTDVKDYFIPISRMFGWVATSVTLTYWSKTDRKMVPRLVDSIVDSINIWLHALTTEEHLLGGRCEYIAGENSLVDLMAGKIKFHIFMTPPSPAQEINFILEYDVDYVREALGAAA